MPDRFQRSNQADNQDTNPLKTKIGMPNNPYLKMQLVGLLSFLFCVTSHNLLFLRFEHSKQTDKMHKNQSHQNIFPLSLELFLQKFPFPFYFFDLKDSYPFQISKSASNHFRFLLQEPHTKNRYLTNSYFHA